LQSVIGNISQEIKCNLLYEAVISLLFLRQVDHDSGIGSSKNKQTIDQLIKKNVKKAVPMGGLFVRIARVIIAILVVSAIFTFLEFFGNIVTGTGYFTVTRP